MYRGALTLAGLHNTVQWGSGSMARARGQHTQRIVRHAHTRSRWHQAIRPPHIHRDGSRSSASSAAFSNAADRAARSRTTRASSPRLRDDGCESRASACMCAKQRHALAILPRVVGTEATRKHGALYILDDVKGHRGVDEGAHEARLFVANLEVLRIPVHELAERSAPVIALAW